MIQYIRNILGTYTPLTGEGLASINIEYVIGAILLIMSVWLCIKCIFVFVKSIFGYK